MNITCGYGKNQAGFTLKLQAVDLLYARFGLNDLFNYDFFCRFVQLKIALLKNNLFQISYFRKNSQNSKIRQNFA